MEYKIALIPGDGIGPEIVSEAKKVLDKDFPQYLIVKTCDKLEKRINRFIKSVFGSMTIKMYQDKKGVDFFYVPEEYKTDPEDKDSWINISMSSGCEKSALSVGWRVALAESYGLDILMLDECDAAATDDSSEKLLGAVLDSSKFSQVFIITHKKICAFRMLFNSLLFFLLFLKTSSLFHLIYFHLFPLLKYHPQ